MEQRFSAGTGGSSRRRTRSLMRRFACSGKSNRARAHDGAPGSRSVAMAGASKPSAAPNYFMSQGSTSAESKNVITN